MQQLQTCSCLVLRDSQFPDSTGRTVSGVAALSLFWIGQWLQNCSHVSLWKSHWHDKMCTRDPSISLPAAGVCWSCTDQGQSSRSQTRVLRSPECAWHLPVTPSPPPSSSHSWLPPSLHLRPLSNGVWWTTPTSPITPSHQAPSPLLLLDTYHIRHSSLFCDSYEHTSIIIPPLSLPLLLSLCHNYYVYSFTFNSGKTNVITQLFLV